MDDRDTFDKKCTELFVRTMFIMRSIQIAEERGGAEEVETLIRLRNDTVQESLDYTLRHWEYLDAETQENWNGVAADLPIARTNENGTDTDED